MDFGEVTFAYGRASLITRPRQLGDFRSRFLKQPGTRPEGCRLHCMTKTVARSLRYFPVIWLQLASYLLTRALLGDWMAIPPLSEPCVRSGSEKGESITTSASPYARTTSDYGLMTTASIPAPENPPIALDSMAEKSQWPLTSLWRSLCRISNT